MDSRLIIPVRLSSKPLLLKDHLLDDMSSCSSNGFKSFPRRQCCTTVRFLHDFDCKSKHRITYVDFKKPQSKSALSALITAVKRLPFRAAKQPEKKKLNINSFLPRRFSKKIFKRGSLWKKKGEHEEIKQWKTFHQLLKEDPEPSDRSCISVTATFTASEEKNDVVERRGEGVSDDSGNVVTNDDVSAESTTSTNSCAETKQSSSDQEKEQFSPVSVLDCPFDEDEVSSPFQHRLARMEGTRKKLLEKIQRFECLAKIEPVNLFASYLDSDNESSYSPPPHFKVEDDECGEEQKALELVDQMKANMISQGLELKTNKLMLDFFKEGIASKKQDEKLVEIARDWIVDRKSGEGLWEWDWEVEKNRQAYVEDMEKGGEWKRLGQENEEVVLELGNEMFAALLNEMLLDVTS